MRTRYTKDSQGRQVKLADIYTKEEHGISLKDIDPDVVFITRKLRAAGFEAYVVGGAVRDLLIGRKPKDFDVATDAHPRSIKKVLPFSRIIGKRFRLVHVYFPGDKIIELATFRALTPGDANAFGTMEEDVRRRDFTLNALFYDPKDELVIDHVGGVQDIRKKRLSNVIPLETIFKEDPVRMLRAVKYATSSGFTIPGPIAQRIKKEASLMAAISPSRLTEEFFKILQGGLAEKIFGALNKFDVLKYFCPKLAESLPKGFFGRPKVNLAPALGVLDQEVKVSEGPLDRSTLVALIILPLLVQSRWNQKATSDNFDQIINWLKDWFKPIIPSNKELDTALREIYRGWAVRPPRKRPPRHRGIHTTEAETHHTDEMVPHTPAPRSPAKKRRRRRKPGGGAPKASE